MELPAYSAEQRAYFRAKAAERRQYRSRCAVCATPITGLAVRRYCSNKCRQANKHAKAKALRLARGPQE